MPEFMKTDSSMISSSIVDAELIEQPISDWHCSLPTPVR